MRVFDLGVSVRLVCAVVLSAVSLLALAPGTAHAVNCGDTVGADLTLTADLVCPVGFSGTVLTVGQDGVTISGQGLYSLVAPQAAVMVNVGAHSGVTVRDLGATSTGNWLTSGAGDKLRSDIGDWATLRRDNKLQGRPAGELACKWRG